jgi:hypothetical protein
MTNIEGVPQGFQVSPVSLESNERVAPGSEKEFKVKLKAPKSLGTIVLSFQMSQPKGQGVFGPTKTVRLQVGVGGEDGASLNGIQSLLEDSSYSNTLYPGTYWVLYGNFDEDGNSVQINGKMYLPDFQSKKQINVKVPDVEFGKVSVIVKTSLGTVSKEVDVSSRIRGVQSFLDGKYSNQISGGTYWILYGNFEPTENVVVVDGQTFYPDFQSTSQINVKIGSVGVGKKKIDLRSTKTSATFEVDVR